MASRHEFWNLDLIPVDLTSFRNPLLAQKVAFCSASTSPTTGF